MLHGMRASRLLSILIELQVRGRMSADALAAQFEVSKRTVYRDVDALSASGVPIYADRGPGGGFQLLDGYRTKLTGLSQPEVEALLLVGLSGPAADLGVAEHAASARLKLLAALPPEATDAALRVGDRFHLDPVEWYRRAAHPACLSIVSRAVWEGRRLTIDYESWTARRPKTVDPYGLVMKGGTWYLVAGTARRTARPLAIYRVDQIHDAAIEDGVVVRPKGFDLARHWHAEVARFEATLDRDTATLRIADGALSRVERLGPTGEDRVRAATPDAAGWRTATVPIESIEHAALLLLGFGPDVEVVEPAALRTRMRALARDVERIYRPGVHP